MRWASASKVIAGHKQMKPEGSDDGHGDGQAPETLGLRAEEEHKT